jgi:hypothetical protein
VAIGIQSSLDTCIHCISLFTRVHCTLPLEAPAPHKYVLTTGRRFSGIRVLAGYKTGDGVAREQPKGALAQAKAHELAGHATEGMTAHYWKSRLVIKVDPVKKG